jgi:hypothetical protein
MRDAARERPAVGAELRDFLRTDRIMNATCAAWSRRAERKRARA